MQLNEKLRCIPILFPNFPRIKYDIPLGIVYKLTAEIPAWVVVYSICRGQPAPSEGAISVKEDPSVAFVGTARCVVVAANWLHSDFEAVKRTERFKKRKTTTTKTVAFRTVVNNCGQRDVDQTDLALTLTWLGAWHRSGPTRAPTRGRYGDVGP